MAATYTERAPYIKAKLQELAQRYGYTLDTLPTFTDQEDFALARREYSAITRRELELVDTLLAMSRASAQKIIYR